ncbi:hypothetical protein MCEREM21A_02313 [Sphingomonadaceae bacterium]
MKAHVNCAPSAQLFQNDAETQPCAWMTHPEDCQAHYPNEVASLVHA